MSETKRRDKKNEPSSQDTAGNDAPRRQSRVTLTRDVSSKYRKILPKDQTGRGGPPKPGGKRSAGKNDRPGGETDGQSRPYGKRAGGPGGFKREGGERGGSFRRDEDSRPRGFRREGGDRPRAFRRDGDNQAEGFRREGGGRPGAFRRDEDSWPKGFRKDGDSRPGAFRKAGDSKSGSFRRDDGRPGSFRRDGDSRPGHFRKAGDSKSGAFRRDGRDSKPGAYRGIGARKPFEPSNTAYRPGPSLELKAIKDRELPEAVSQLNQAQALILDSANDLLSLVESLREKHSDLTASVNEAIERHGALLEPVLNPLKDGLMAAERDLTGLFEKMSFQDLAGQRLFKVENFLNALNRVLGSKNSTGPDRESRGHPNKEGFKNRAPKPLAGENEGSQLKGPQAPGEGMEQDEIDQLLTEI